MKRIDLHIHTKPANYENKFDFSIDKMVEYVNDLKLDIIAITNHNLFDRNNFDEIKRNINIKVFPGVEIDIEKGHLLLIADESLIDELELSCAKLSLEITNKDDYILFDEFKSLFPFYNKCILIPHIDKKPKISSSTIIKFNNIIKCGEVGSAKKFEVNIKDQTKLPPVFFSDLRIADECKFNYRTTYLDIDSVEFSVLKTALGDKTKLFLNPKMKRDFFEFDEYGTIASTGLNVILGKRSSGKTTLLEKINSSSLNCKYIKQFSLTGDSEETKFNSLVSNYLVDEKNNYIESLKKLIEIIVKIESNYLTKLDDFVSSLKDFATNTSLQDAYSKTKIFTESFYNYNLSNKTLDVIKAIDKILSYDENQELIDKYIDKNNLKILILELISIRKKEYKLKKLMDETDKIVKSIQDELKQISSMKPIVDVDLNDIYKSKFTIDSFNELCKLMKTKNDIDYTDIFGYKLVLSRDEYSNATEVKEKIKTSSSLKNIFNYYKSNNFYEYVHELNKLRFSSEVIANAIINLNVKVLTSKGVSPSGGERAEFNLLKELKDSEQYDVLLIDEPEASFDNPFIMKNITKIIKNLSLKSTVFLTTHNNTLGMLMKPDMLIYTYHDGDVFDIYEGEFGAKELVNSTGKTINSFDKIIDVMEAGEIAYKERKNIYEDIKN